MNITVKEATAADAELIADLSRRTFYDSFAPDNNADDMNKFLDEQFTKPALMEEVSAAGNIFLLAYADGEVAGYARLREKSTFRLNEPEALELARLYAETKWIGKGVGKALMEACIEIARQKCKRVLWLGVWENNQRAIDFYRQFGFEKFADADFVLGNDVQQDWLMKKMLG
jgi:diamine N-acetyltransferase